MYDVCIIKESIFEYPNAQMNYSPSVQYPEYPFNVISNDTNYIYDMVRSMLIAMEMDKEQIEKASWNPLGTIIAPGDRVLVKPNWVNNINACASIDCMVTHPSVVRAIVDYCVIAKAGEIIIADAPIQGCNIYDLWSKQNYEQMIEFYRRNGVDLKICDLRERIVNVYKGHVSNIHYNVSPSIIVDMSHESEFTNSQSNNNKYGIIGYSPKKINENHRMGKHIYKISKKAMEADVIINISKPKTHRYAGITAAMKNFVGVCADKECLPHFTYGATQEGGDENNSNTVFSKRRRVWEDKYLESQEANRKALSAISRLIYGGYKVLMGNKHSNGAWYGNDTIWRTIHDLNYALIYADKDGVIHPGKRQRNILNVGDMIIAGEGAGPLSPSPKPLGIIIGSTNAVVFDLAVCRIMGLTEEKILSVRNALHSAALMDKCIEDVVIASNLSEIHMHKLIRWSAPKEWAFIQHPAWKEFLEESV